MTNNLSNDQNSEVFIEQLAEKRFVLETEGLDQDGLLELLTQNIQALPTEDVRVVCLIGGAASGKTTLAGRIVKKLEDIGTTADRISTDDYVVGDREYRRQHFEGHSPLEKYDFDLMNQHIEKVRQNTGNGIVRVPTYDEESGVAIAAGEENFTHKIEKVDVLVVEGDFNRVNSPDLLIYLHTPDDHRLQIRLDRDPQKRLESDPAGNFSQRQETQHFPHTLPAAEEAHVLIRANPAEEGWKFDVYRRTN